jgi:putative ABC transport system ATP-binding protein
MGLLEGLWHEYGLTFIMVTHDSSIARRAPRLATIKAGQITLKEQGGGVRRAAAAQSVPAAQYGGQGV